jgi:VIT1/CCC1 family predicted Fe2+/Mn2+ transporter
MAESSKESEASGWYRRFVERLDPGERMGELLFGLIMVLTFTLGAGVELSDREETRDLLIAALGCNTAWGIIDAALYLIARLSERGRLYRLAKAIQESRDDEQALALVGAELEERLPTVVKPEMRAALDSHVLEQVRALKLGRNRLTAEDLWAALAVFWLVFLTALPAAAPFLLITQPHIAMRTSNALLIGLLSYLGWRWAGYTGAGRWRTAIFMALLGIALVLVAIALGG